MLLLLSVSAGLASMQPCAATPFQWEYTRSLKTERSTSLHFSGDKPLAFGFKCIELYLKEENGVVTLESALDIL